MEQTIRLLPDHIANQIAAGEVIQRPSSVVKELMENAVDAQATRIKVILKDSGKTLIQVVDNGKGMSTTDAQMCFERHATSKIASAEDLFALQTNGFRGEALASIVAIAHLRLKTKRAEDSEGFFIDMEGSVSVDQGPVSMKNGTSIEVKNLFYNVPARRNFLKSDKAEFRHISETFIRIALTEPKISFELWHNDQPMFQTESGSQKQRIVSLFGSTIGKRLIKIEHQSEAVQIRGFIVKPEFAKSSRGEQYFFANGRFIKHPYLHHALCKALEPYMVNGKHPSYFIHISVPGNTIDVNIHPTKTDVKFDNNQFLYALLLSAAKQSISQGQVAPSIDFQQSKPLDFPRADKQADGENAHSPFSSSSRSGSYNPFEQLKPQDFRPDDWKTAYPTEHTDELDSSNRSNDNTEIPLSINESANTSVFMTDGGTYFLALVNSTYYLVHRREAHVRVLFEQAKLLLSSKSKISQQLILPITIELTTIEQQHWKEVEETFRSFGFLSQESEGSISISAIPLDFPEQSVETFVHFFCSELHESLPSEELTLQWGEYNARKHAVRTGDYWSKQEYQAILHSLFEYPHPEQGVSGRTILKPIDQSTLERIFNL